MNFSKYFSSDGIFATDDYISLTQIFDDEYSDYEELERENSLTKHFLSIIDFSEFMQGLWNDLKNGKSLVCSIRKVEDNSFCGYCQINDVTTDEDELGIRLLERVHRQGIGFRALNLLMKRYSEINGNKYFISKVDATNYISQHLMEKLGGVPDGICELLIHDENLKTKIETEYFHLIDDKLIAVAEKFNVKPEKLISHVLKYRIDI